jgi:hypothetical protein
MKSKIWLRFASIIMFLHDVGHTFGHLTWKSAGDPLKQEVINQMLGKKFPFMGAVRSMGEFYDGYGFASTLALLLISVILWMLSDALPGEKPLTSKILILVSIILLAWGIVEVVFFFPFAAMFSFLAMVLTVIALFQLHKKMEPELHRS